MEGIQKQLLKATETDSEQSWEQAAASEVLQTLEYLFQRLPEGSENYVELGHRLEEAQDLLEAGVECSLNLWLGSFATAITRPLREQWDFPAGHLPIGAEVANIQGQPIEPIYVCSWNVEDLGLASQPGGKSVSKASSTWFLRCSSTGHIPTSGCTCSVSDAGQSC